MNKPRFTGCTAGCQGGKRCWQQNHIPYAGLLLQRYGTFANVYEIIFKRYMRVKKFAWPDEVREFNAIYQKKHPELMRGHQVKNSMSMAAYFGAVYVEKDRGFVIRAFGRGGVLHGDPYTPAEKLKQHDFFRLSGRRLMGDIKTPTENQYGIYEGLLFH